MSDSGAYESDMGWLKKLSDEEIEQALAGSYDGEDACLGDLAAFARDAKAALAGVPGEATREAHLASMSEASVQSQREPVATGAPAASPGPLRRWKLVLTQMLATLTAKIALAGVAVAATTGGLAATGSLPEPAQMALANAAEKVGFELPAGEMNEDQGPPGDLPNGAKGSPAQAVLEVIRNWEGDKGCDFGHAVAEAAGGNPGPCKDDGDEDGDNGGRPDGAGKPEGTPQGKPDGAGKPEGTPKGKPDGAGKPEGTPQGKPDGAGKPGGTPQAKPDGAGKPEGTPQAKPDGAGKPEGAPGGGDNGAPEGTGSDGKGEGGNDLGDGSGGSGGPPDELPAPDGGKPDSVPGGKP